MITLSILLISLTSLIYHTNGQCGDSEPLTAQCSSSDAQCAGSTNSDDMTISLTLCSDNFIYIQITYTTYANKWFGIRFQEGAPTGSKMLGKAVIYTTGTAGNDEAGLYSHTITASSLGGIAKDAQQFWDVVSTTITTGITTTWKISNSNAATLYGWDQNTASVIIYYVLASGAQTLTLAAGGHGAAYTQLTLNYPTPTTTDNATPDNTGTTAPVDTGISMDDVIALRDTLWTKFDSGTFDALAATTVRLAFHDCAGFPENVTSGIVSTCNGCIDFTSDDHPGLSSVVDQLEEIFLNQGPNGESDNTKWTDKMSLADFWMAAATVAIELTHSNSNKEGELPAIPFYFGREECSTSPNTNTTISPTVKDLPDATAGWEDVQTWFETNFDMSIEETVALIGIHTIGIKHFGVSGMDRFWVADWGMLDNQFYFDLMNNDWQQQSNGQWNSGSASMMNVDIALFKFIDNELNETDGSVGCLFADCPENNDTKSIVQSFADDNAVWLEMFVQAFIKMITVGYEDGELIEIILEEETTTEFPFSDISTTFIDAGTTESADEEEGEFDVIEWVTENWYFVAGGVVVLIIIICLCVCCCKMSKKRQAKRQKDIEMFGTHEV